MKPIAFILAVSLVAWDGCAAVILGEYMKSSSDRATRERFLADYRAHNLELKKAGLDTLDFCEEAMRFDAGWARSLPECKQAAKVRSHH